jgi:hypothetical protein
MKADMYVCRLSAQCTEFRFSETRLPFYRPVNQKRQKTTGVFVFIYHVSTKQSSHECKTICYCDLLDRRYKSLFILSGCFLYWAVVFILSGCFYTERLFFILSGCFLYWAVVFYTERLFLYWAVAFILSGCFLYRAVVFYTERLFFILSGCFYTERFFLLSGCFYTERFLFILSGCFRSDHGLICTHAAPVLLTSVPVEVWISGDASCLTVLLDFVHPPHGIQLSWLLLRLFCSFAWWQK